MKNAPVAALLLLIAAAPVAPAQPACRARACTAADFWSGAGELQSLKTDFVSALREFAQSTSGAYGDEGARLPSQLAAVRRALESWDRAIAAYESEARMAGANADARAALGAVFLERSRVREALIELDPAARIDSRRADIHLLKAIAHELAGDRTNAAEELERAAAITPRDMSVLYRLESDLSAIDSPKAADAQQRLDAAHLAASDRDVIRFDRIGLLRQASGVAPVFPPQRYVAGFRLIEAGRYAEGVTALRQAVDGDPLAASTAAGPAASAGSRLRQGQLQAALSVLRGAVAQSPDAETWRIAGVAYWADEQYDRSIEALTSASHLDRNDERLRIALADVLLAADRSTDAEQALKDVVARWPDSGQAHFRLGQLYQSRSLIAEAISQYERAMTCSPLIGLDYLYDTLGGLYALQADFDRAGATYRRRVDVNPNNAEAHRKLGEIYALQGRDLAGLSEFVVAGRLDMKNAGAFSEAGQIYLRAGRFADAVRASRASLALDPRQQKARFTVGTALMRLGNTADGQRELDRFQRDVDEAAAARRAALEVKTLERDAARAEMSADYAQSSSLLRRALDLAPEDAQLEVELGRMLVKAGQPSQALAHLAKAGESGDWPEIHQVLTDAYAALKQPEAHDREETLYRQLVQRRKEERLKTRFGDLASRDHQIAK